MFKLVAYGCLVSAMLSFVACGDGGDSPKPPGSEETPPGEDVISEESEHLQLLRRYSRAQCMTSLMCPTYSLTSSRPPESLEVCETTTLADLSASAGGYYDGESVRFDEERLAELESLVETVCPSGDTYSTHWEAWFAAPVVGLLPEGAPCGASSQCAAGACVKNGDPVGECVAPTLALGATCTANDECIPTGGTPSYCAIVTGEAEGTCRRLTAPDARDEGQFCGVDPQGMLQACVHGFWCHNGACTRPPPVGDYCGGHMNGPAITACVAGATCRTIPVDNLGICVRPVYLSEGEHCTPGPHNHLERCSFEQGLHCDPDESRCVPHEMECFHDAECGDGAFCAPPDFVCIDLVPNGIACIRDAHCISGHCDIDVGELSGMCAAP